WPIEDHLQRHRSVEAELSGAIYHAHAAARDLLDQLIIPEIAGSDLTRQHEPGDFGRAARAGFQSGHQAEPEQTRRTLPTRRVPRQRSAASGTCQTDGHRPVLSDLFSHDSYREQSSANYFDQMPQLLIYFFSPGNGFRY